jgi:hypothetical protein
MGDAAFFVFPTPVGPRNSIEQMDGLENASLAKGTVQERRRCRFIKILGFTGKRVIETSS